MNTWTPFTVIASYTFGGDIDFRAELEIGDEHVVIEETTEPLDGPSQRGRWTRQEPKGQGR